MAVAPDVVCRDWTLHQVTEFFRGLGLGQYVEAVQEHGIDGPILSELIRMDGLDDIGVISKLHKAKIYSHLRRRAAPVQAESVMAGLNAISKFRDTEVTPATRKMESTERTPSATPLSVVSEASSASMENLQQGKLSTGNSALKRNQPRRRRDQLIEVSPQRESKRLVVRPSSETDAWIPSCSFAPHQLAPEVRMQIFDFVPLVELFRLTCTARALRDVVLHDQCRLSRLCSDVNFTTFGDTMLLCLRTASSMERYSLRARRPRGHRTDLDVGARLVGLLRVPALSTLIRRLDLKGAPADLIRSEILWAAIDQLEYLENVEFPTSGWPDTTERRKFEGERNRIMERNRQRSPDAAATIKLGEASRVGEPCPLGATSLLV